MLIHGTWHGGWAWDAVIRELSGNGHRGHAPTFAGHGPAVARLGMIRRIVFLDALVLKDNIFDILPGTFLDTLEPKDGNDVIAPNEDGTMQIPPWETWCDNFIQVSRRA